MAGVSAAAPAASSCTAGVSRVPRIARVTPAESAMTASTRGRWKANRISGSDRRARGRTSSDSSSLTGPAKERLLGREHPLAPRCDLEPTFVRADGARPGRRPVHEHAVLERHPAQPDLLLAHRGQASYAAPTDSAAWRRKSTPSSRSAIAARSSAEWMSLDASSALISLIGKNP